MSKTRTLLAGLLSILLLGSTSAPAFAQTEPDLAQVRSQMQSNLLYVNHLLMSKQLYNVALAAFDGAMGAWVVGMIVYQHGGKNLLRASRATKEWTRIWNDFASEVNKLGGIPVGNTPQIKAIRRHLAETQELGVSIERRYMGKNWVKHFGDDYELSLGHRMTDFSRSSNETLRALREFKGWHEIPATEKLALRSQKAPRLAREMLEVTSHYQTIVPGEVAKKSAAAAEEKAAQAAAKKAATSASKKTAKAARVAKSAGKVAPVAVLALAIGATAQAQVSRDETIARRLQENPERLLSLTDQDWKELEHLPQAQQIVREFAAGLNTFVHELSAEEQLEILQALAEEEAASAAPAAVLPSAASAAVAY